jgi:hypothetical protein
MEFTHSSAVIPVDLQVTRYRPYPEDGVVEVWGYVGDYEVCVHLAIADAETRGLRTPKPGRATPARKNSERH